MAKHLSINKVVLITGCSSGFGFRTAVTFASNGYITYASVRNLKSEGTLTLQKIAQRDNLPLKIVEIDISKDASVKNGVGSIIKKEKQIDILVNNAGWSDKGPVEEYPIKDIIEQYQTSVFGILRMVKAISPIMRKNRQGLIINISSLNGLIALPMAGIYSSAKYAAEALTEVLRFELSHFGIAVTQIEPGSFLTEGYDRNFKQLNKSYVQDSSYRSVVERYIDNIDSMRGKAEKNFLARKLFDPQRVADLILKISQTTNPKMRYRIGIDTAIYYFAKKFLPERLWEWLLHRAYQW